MLAGRDRRARVLDADRGIAGGLHDHFNIARCRFGGIGCERGGSDPLGIPADRAARLSRTLGIEIDDHRHLDARRVRHLRQKHRAELAGTDQRDVNGFAGREADVEQVRKVHAR